MTPTFAGANHNPKIVLGGPNILSARPGQRIALSARTSDPDGDTVTLKWWVWKDAGTYKAAVDVRSAGGHGAILFVPADAQPGEVIQIIAEATDDDTMALTRYEKVVVTII